MWTSRGVIAGNADNAGDGRVPWVSPENFVALGEHHTFQTGDTNDDGAADFMIRVDGAIALTSSDFMF